MKISKAILILIIFFCINSMNAQDIVKENLEYKTWVKLNGDLPSYFRWNLYKLNESSLTIVKNPANNNSINDNSTTIDIGDIKIIKFRRPENMWIGAMAGACIGFGTGYLVGSSGGDSWLFSANDKGMLLGIPSAGLGAILGASLGAIKIRIPINGNMDTYNSNKAKLKRYSYMR